MNEYLDIDSTVRTDDTTTGATATGPSGGHSLVVLDPESPETTLRAVLGHPGAADEGLHLLLVHPVRTYEQRRRARASAGVTAPYSLDQFAAEADRDVARLGREWLDRTGTTVEVTGAVGRVRDHVRAAVAAAEYDRVYVPGERRGLLRRLLGGGDLASEVRAVLPADLPLVVTDIGHADSVVPPAVVPADPAAPVADPDPAGGED